MGRCLARRPESLKIAAVGRKTARRLDDLGASADFVPPTFVADSLIDHFPVSGWGLRILLPRVQSGGRTLLAEAFGEAGSRVVEVAAYESRCPETIPHDTLQALEASEVDAVSFSSGKTVSHTVALLTEAIGNDRMESVFQKPAVVSIGPRPACAAWSCWVVSTPKPAPMTSMGWWKRAFKPYNGAEPDPRPSRQDILGVDQCFECSNPRAAARLHPRGNGPAVRHTPCQHPRLSEPERGVHHPPATHPERSHPEPRLHQRQRLQDSWFPRSIPPSPPEARRVQRGPIALPARMPEPGPDWGAGSILVRMPSQGMLPVPRPLPQLEPVQVTGIGRDQA